MNNRTVFICAAIVCMAWIPSGIKAEDQYEKVFVGEAYTNILWTADPAYQNWSTTISGDLPPGLVYKQLQLYPMFTFISGVICGTPLPAGNAASYEFSIKNEIYDNDKNTLISACDKTFLLQVDDYADIPVDTGHLGTLPVLTEWSEDSDYGWSNGYVSVADQWKGIFVMQDWDIFAVACTTGTYCVEIDTVPTDNGKPLEIAVFDKNYIGEYGNKLAEGKTWNVYDDNGTLSATKQRVYFYGGHFNGILIRIACPYDEMINRKYKIRLFAAEPVILIHGINAYPLNSSDTESTFGDIKWLLPFIGSVKPSICYDFPWDSHDNDNPEGFKRYVGANEKEDETLYKYVYDIFMKHKQKITIIAHSMGGFVIRFQLREDTFSDMITQAIFVDSPQYGSELANFLYRRRKSFDAPGKFLNTLGQNFDIIDWGVSDANSHHLMRGGDTIYEMHTIGTVLPSGNISCTIGTEKGFFKILPATMKEYDSFTIGRVATRFTGALYLTSAADVFGIIRGIVRDQYSKGLEHSDGIVPVSSQNMKSLHPDIETIYIAKCHTEVQKLYLKNFDDARKLFNLIKRRINIQ